MSAESSTAKVENPLSERERDVAQVLATGATNTEIARELYISPHTVKVHIRNIFDKLEVGSRTEASMVLIQHGWVTIPGLAPAPEPAEAVVPDPAPLDNLDAHPTPWQLVYLVVAIVVVIGLVSLPNWLNRPEARPDLLTDVGVASLGQPSIPPEPRWEARTPLSQPTSRMGVVREDNWIYVIGGENNQGTLASMAAYDLDFNRWQPLADLPAPRANVAAAIINGAIYIAGGSSDETDGVTVANILWRYDIARDQWESAGWLPAPLAGAALAPMDESLYLLGGWDGEKMRDEIWRIDLAARESALEGNWEYITSLESPRAFFGATANEDGLYVVGGYDGQQELSDATRYNLGAGAKEVLLPLSSPRGGLSLVNDGRTLYALGGGWTFPVDTHERFDPATGSWSNFPSPVQGVWRHLGAASKDGRLYLLGGWSEAYLDSHLEYQSSFRALLPVITN